MKKKYPGELLTIVFMAGFVWAMIFREFNAFIRMISFFVGSILITLFFRLKRKKKDAIQELTEMKNK